MNFLILCSTFLAPAIFNTAFCIPVLPGHFNAHALDSGMSIVEIEKDVVLSPGRGGNNFNAEAEDNGKAAVTIGGAVHGFAANRTGEEFNAISKKKGTSQVRVNGDLLVENLDPSVKKFDAVSESEGHSLVQVGNVVILAGSKGDSRFARQLQNETQRQPAAETPWGAAAVADHNSKPWETINHGVVDDAPVAAHDPVAVEKPEVAVPAADPISTVEPLPSESGHDTSTPSVIPTTVVGVDSPPPSVVSPNSSPPQALPAAAVVPDQTQITEPQHQPETLPVESVVTSPVPTNVPEVIPITSEKPVIVIVPEIPKPHPAEITPEPEGSTNNNNHVAILVPHPNGGYSAGSLNAVSAGQGSKSAVLVKGFVQF